jgi:DNA primase
MLKESQLFSLLDKVLSQTAYIRKGEEAVYFCPFCSHYKKKLEVNVRTQEWHCWICNSCGKSIRSLFYKLKAKESYFDELYKIVGKSWKRIESGVERPQNLSLPDEFIPLWKPSKSFGYGHAMSYLQDRHVTMDDVLRYNIGYCEEGIYRQRVLVPSYDRDGNVNFFAARAYHEGNPYKYMLAPWPKDIIGFELFVNWNEPITLVEGTFDAIAVRNNAIPLFGTTLTFLLKLAIVKNKVKRVNIVLDNDALRQAVDIFDRIEDLQVGKIDIHLVRLGEKDPSVLGFETINELIDKSKAFDFSDIIKARLNR